MDNSKDKSKINNVIGNINSESTPNGNAILKSTSSIFLSSFYFQDYYDDNLCKAFIKDCEKLIRQSDEYNQYLATMKANYNILNFDNVESHISASDCDIEFHHYPFTLYEIVDIVMMHHLLKKDNFTSFSIAKEVMELHFKQWIGFVPLTTTNHELAHDGSIFISSKQIIGDWRKFANVYADALSTEYKAKIEKLDNMTLLNAATDFSGIYK